MCVGTSSGPSGLLVEVWWKNVPSRVANEFLWDKTHAQGLGRDAVEELQRQLPSKIGIKPLEWFQCTYVPPTAPKAAPPLFHYHPQRVRNLLPFGRGLSNVAQRASNGLTVDVLQQIAETYFHSIQANQFSAETTLRSRLAANKKDPRGMQRAISGYASFVSFEAAGRAIFDIPKVLTEMFAHTDIDAVPMDMLKAPYSTQYLHFGPQEEMEIRDGWRLDGAYVTCFPGGGMQICMTAAPPTVETFANFHVEVEPFQVLTLTKETAEMSLGDAVDHALSSLIAELRNQVANEPLAEAAREMGQETELNVRSAQATHAAKDLESLPARHEMFMKMLKLVVNALCYLTAYPDDVTKQWAPGTPDRLRDQATDPANKDKQRRNAQSKLLSMGYTLVHTCGDRLNEEIRKMGDHPDDLSSEERKGYTWVRGHYLRQVYGPGFSMRKLQWRMPRLARMRKEASDEVAIGHVYRVG